MKLRAFKLDPFDGRYTASTRNEKHTYIVEAFGSDGRCEVSTTTKSVWLLSESEAALP